MEIQAFDPSAEFAIHQRKLPHWSQAGAVTFITFRTWDSIPKAVFELWLAERDAWLERQGIDPMIESWSLQLNLLSQSLIDEFHKLLADRWNEHLDDCHGEWVLRRPELAKTVADSLHHFDGDRYELTDFVVMPNHVHVLVAFPDDTSLLKNCTSWKHYSATQINRRLKTKGRFWQQDGFDHLVRSPEQFEALRRYIADNPNRARLAPGEYLHFSKSLRAVI
jgi:putative transposase